MNTYIHIYIVIYIIYMLFTYYIPNIFSIIVQTNYNI